jgi:hypothetical protein
MHAIVDACFASTSQQAVGQCPAAADRHVKRRMATCQLRRCVDQVLMALDRIQIANGDEEPVVLRQLKFIAKRDSFGDLVANAVRNRQDS